MKYKDVLDTLKGRASADVSVYLGGDVTFNIFSEYLRCACIKRGFDIKPVFGPFAQYYQDLQCGKIFSTEKNLKIAVFFFSWMFKEDLHNLKALWQVCRDHQVVPIQVLLPPVPYEPLSLLGIKNGAAQKNLAVNSLITKEDVICIEPPALIWSEQKWREGRIYPFGEDLWELTWRLSGMMAAVLGKAKKCLVLDLDNTLWQGILGEDGESKIIINKEFQKYILGLKERGIILAIASKNNEQDALPVFRDHPEMILREKDIACFEINWSDKATQLKNIAQKLNIGIDSLVFVDDNVVERELIRQACPEVACIEIDPGKPEEYVVNLHAGYWFEAVRITAEDQARNEQYHANAQRQAQAAACQDINTFIKSLDQEVIVEKLNDYNIERIVQLINKTNQFNLTTERLNKEELLSLVKKGGVCLGYRVKDKFGDNGLVGVIILTPEKKGYYIHTFLLSCRVLGRRIEQVLLATLNKYLPLRGEYKPAAKNVQVKDFYAANKFIEGCRIEEFDQVAEIKVTYDLG